MTNDTAILSNDGNMTIFSYGSQILKFRAPSILEKYLEVKKWDDGYLVVSAEYKGIGVDEEYIDLMPILRNLYIDPSFLSPIKKVIIQSK